MVSKVISWLIGLAVVDAIIPLPITGAIVLYALVKKPRWFLTVCEEVLGDAKTGEEPPPL